MNDVKMKLFALGMTVMSQFALANGTIVNKGPVLKKTAVAKKAVVKTKTTKTLSPQEETPVVKTGNVLKRPVELIDGLSIGYDISGTDIGAAQSAIMVSYDVQPGLKMIGGFSLKNPSCYSYGAIEVHSLTTKGFLPSFQIGGGTFQDEGINDGDRVTGALLGVSLDYVVNHFATLNTSFKFIGNGFDHNEGDSLGSLGVRFKL